MYNQTNTVNDDNMENTDGSLPEIHLWDYVQIILQRLPLVATVFFVIMFLAILYTWTRTPLYRATAQLLIQENQINLTGLQDAYDPISAGGARRELIGTQMRLISSRPVMESAIQKANLLSDPAFARAKNPIDKLSEVLQVSLERNTHLVNISVERKNKVQAARIVNAVVDAFLAENSKRRLGVSEDGLEELQQKAEAQRIKLDNITRQLQAFMVQNSMVSFEKTQNIIVDKLKDLNNKLTQTEPVRMALQARVESAEIALEKGITITTLPDVMSSPVIRELKMGLTTLQQEYSQLLQRLGENHPQLQAVSTQMESLQTRIAMESSQIVNSIKIQYEQIKAEETLLRAALRKHEEEVFRFNELASEYNLLNQTKASIERTYETIIRRIEEISMNRISGQGNNVFIISRASVPTEKSWPNKRKNMLVAFMLAIGSAVALCFFADYMDTTIKSEVDIRSFTASHVLAAVPDLKIEAEGVENADLIVLDKPNSHFAEAFRSLRTSLAFNTSGPVPKTLVISSTMPEEGKSLIAINLAITEAQIGKKTLLIDADMRKPRLHHVFGVSPSKGLSHLLTEDDSSADSAITTTNIKNLHLLACGKVPTNPVELLDSIRFTDLIRGLESKFDLIIIDSPPSITLVDSLVTARNTGGIILVVRSFVTLKTAVRQVTARIHESGVRLLGVVLNNVDVPRSARYYTSYYSRYGYYYGTSGINKNLSPKAELTAMLGNGKTVISKLMSRTNQRKKDMSPQNKRDQQ